jgi:glycosyltransferase involved in cell wall biosynthesis
MSELGGAPVGPVVAPPAAAGVRPLEQAPAFSIVITAYEAAATIAAAVRSSLGQTHPAHEVIVVDDGSKDDLTSALAPFEGQISVVRKQNGGGASARNAGVAAASGEFMAILDADDTYQPRRLEALASLARARPDLDLLTTDARFVVDGKGVGSFSAHNEFSAGDQRAAIFANCFVGGWPAVRLSRLAEIGGFDEQMRIAYDWDCWLRLILHGAIAGMVDEPLYDYVLHSGSLASSRVASLWERVRLLEKARINPLLREDEKPLVEAAIRRRRNEAVLEETKAVLDGAMPRRHLLDLALAGGTGLRERGLAGLALTAPPLARRVVSTRLPPEQRFAESES